ncbi:hypothetical protein B7494_g1813 [Chlorociboria aeruginascens]|nr:hypothetical protein B7494_g1813 [Chlorociboria aeruginascens]
MLRNIVGHNRLSWLSGPLGATYAAALGLVAIQVGMGIILKIAQKGGTYEFSPSSSVTLSEFFKMVLSTIFFYRECRKRNARNVNPSHTALPTSERNSFEESKAFSGEQMNGNGESSGSHVAERYKNAREPYLDLRTFWGYCKNEVSRDTRYGFAQLALFYALINNTIFVAFKLADPGTIQLTKSGVTFITALVMIFTLGSKITKVQWIAIVIQICGLMVTQYHPETGTSYPISTYLILLFQVFLSALSGVYNQALLKSDNASLHADNMILYASGAAINLILHFTIRLFKADEPGFFTGYGSIGAFMVVMSNVFIGLAITAVYKSVSTGILLYLSPILFGTELSFLVLPGTIVVFIASWLYMEGAAPKDPNPPPKESNSEPQKLSIFGKMAAVSKLHHKTVLVSGTIFTVIVVAFLTMGNSQMPDPVGHKAPTPSASNGGSKSSSGGTTNDGSPILTSPFKNTLAMVRWNSNHPERMPLLMKYAPFFHDMHFSMPHYLPDKPEYHNLTHDSWETIEYPYLQIAKTMQLILDAKDNDPTSEIDGLLYYHFDAWIDPLAYTGANMHNIWFPDVADIAPPNAGGPRFECMTNPEKYNWWGWGNNFHHSAMAAAAVVDHFDMDYVVNPKEWCVGWTDIYYVPKRFFADYIFLASIFGGFSVFHEVAVPTMIHIIDQSRRRHPMRSVMDKFGDCWGSCCASNPDEHDILWNRCGHRLDYLNEAVINAHYNRVDEQAKMLGEAIGETTYATHHSSSPSKFSAETLHALALDKDPELDADGNVVEPAKLSAAAIADANTEMDRLAAQREKNIIKSVPAAGSPDGVFTPDASDPLTDGSSHNKIVKKR